jgi:hypothetical protein
MRKYYGSLLDEYMRAGMRIMMRVVGSAKRRAPVDKGAMRASIGHPEVYKRGGRIVGRLGSSLDYAKRTEFPNKFLGKAERVGAGTVEHPYTSWPALRARGGSGQTMPWLRPAFIDVLSKWALYEVRKAVRMADGR